MTTPPPARPKVPRPAGALLTKSKGGGRGGNDATIFVSFVGGLIRRLTTTEFERWDDVTIDREIPIGKEYDHEYDYFVECDNALRLKKG